LTQCRAVVALYNEYRLARTKRRRSVIAQGGKRERERGRQTGTEISGEEKRYIGDIPENEETKTAVGVHVKKKRGSTDEGEERPGTKASGKNRVRLSL